MSASPLTGKIEFIAYQELPLLSGDYTISITQKIEANGKITNDNGFEAKHNFSVFGPRFELTPQDIHSVFPPPGSRGDHNNVLPHIILNRSTIPWERDIWANETSNDPKNPRPWLALLVFYEEEKQKGQVSEPKICTLKHSEDKKFWLLEEASQEPDDTNKTINPPDLLSEKAQHEGDRVTVIDVEKSLLQNLLPTTDDLQFLAHVRQRKDDQRKPIDHDVSVIIANRLPKNHGNTTVHLVSLENCFKKKELKSEFDYGEVGARDLIRLISLKSWNFSCLEPKYSFQGLLTNLKPEISPDSQQNLLLRLPQQEFPGIPFIDKGYVPLPHYMRKGDKTISWYHGPLVPWQNTLTSHDHPIQVSDELLRYDPSTGLFDVSYAAAWQLGRMLALQDKRLSVSLFNWKRAHLKNHHQVEQFMRCCHIIPQASSDELCQDIPTPPEDQAWFNRLKRLEDIPFNYLVPDERMLPNESIRFFWVDPLWVDCLLKGAFSIGETCELTYQHDYQSLADNRYAQMTGILLRSEVVAGYPGLLVDGYYGAKKLPLLRMERLSENVLLCLFEGEIARIDIYQKAETLHFGLKDIDGTGQFTKDLKNDNGQESGKPLETIPFRDGASGVIEIYNLAEKIRGTKSSKFTSAQFALQMVEGTPLFSFHRQTKDQS